MSRATGSRRPPFVLVLTAGVVVAALLLPLAYLLVRIGDDAARALEVLGEASTWRLVWNTVILVVGVVVAAVAVAVPLAWLVTRTDLPGRRAWAVAGALPLVIPSYVAALCLLGAFGERGLLADLLGVDRLPDITGYWGAVAALTLAVSGWRSFARVTAPSIRPAVGLGALLVALYTLSDFGVVSLMRYDALTRAIYIQYRSLFDRTPAATLALLLVLLTAIALIAEYHTRRRGRLHRTGPGSPRPAPAVTLGRWTAPALAYCTLVTGLFLILPATILVTWLVRGIVNDRDLEAPWSALVDSLGASGLAAAAAVLAALPVAVLATRYPGRRTRTLERLSYAGNALPGLVIALALVFFAARYASPVYQTLALLVFAYVVRFFPQAMSGVESSLQRVSPRVEEAARGLGRGPLATTMLVTVPLARSGVLAGAALVFLSAMKELPATLLLRPIGFETLATEIWKLTQVGAYSRAALPALVLIVASAPVLYLVSRDRRLESGAGG